MISAEEIKALMAKVQKHMEQKNSRGAQWAGDIGCANYGVLRIEAADLFYEMEPQFTTLQTLLNQAAEVIENLRERIEIEGGFGEYKGGKPFVMKDARELLNTIRPYITTGDANDR